MVKLKTFVKTFLAVSAIEAVVAMSFLEEIGEMVEMLSPGEGVEACWGWGIILVIVGMFIAAVVGEIAQPKDERPDIPNYFM